MPLIFAGPGISQSAVCSEPVELLDIYPTLIELCELPARPKLEGHSLGPQLKDAAAERPWPAITTHNPDNHAVRSGEWRYLRYADGSEELYDVQNDPHEWHNLADKPQHRDVIESLRQWLPESSALPAPGSFGRILAADDGRLEWEGEVIGPEDPVPGL